MNLDLKTHTIGDVYVISLAHNTTVAAAASKASHVTTVLSTVMDRYGLQLSLPQLRLEHLHSSVPVDARNIAAFLLVP